MAKDKRQKSKGKRQKPDKMGRGKFVFVLTVKVTGETPHSWVCHINIE